MKLLQKSLPMPRMRIRPQPSTGRRWMLFSLLLLLFLAGASLCVGASFISPLELIRASLGQATPATQQKLLFVRIPRTFSAAIAGAALALSGYILQSVLQNELCSPNIIGVNTGSVLAIVSLSLVTPFTNVLTRPIAAFIGAIAAVLTVYYIASRANLSRSSILLAGIAANSLFAAVTDSIVTLHPDGKITRADFSIGSFQNVNSQTLLVVLPFFIAVLFFLVLLQPDLHLLMLGDDTARSLGMNVSFKRTLFLICAGILAGCAVSLGGLIGFVGLIVPHITKLIFKNKPKQIFIFILIFGAVLCLFCDILSRVLFSPYEIPVGILLSVIGAPFFLYLIISRRKKT